VFRRFPGRVRHPGGHGLIRQRHASSHTIAAYRDALRLLLGYAAERTGRAPSALDIADVDAPLIGGFLDHLERERGNSVRTRNAGLAAIHSLFGFAALAHPEHAASIARALAIPTKRFDRALISYLAEPEVDALLACCDSTTWTGPGDAITRSCYSPCRRDSASLRRK
jgi:integrase/recombinase XerD